MKKNKYYSVKYNTRKNPISSTQYYVLWKNEEDIKIIAVDTIEQVIRFVEVTNLRLNQMAFPLFRSDLVKIRKEIDALLGVEKR